MPQPFLLMILICLLFVLVLIWSEYIKPTFPHDKPKLKSRLIATVIYGLALTWYVLGSTAPYEAKEITYHEIQELTDSDETKSQVFIVDGKPVNLTILFGKIVDSEKFHVRRTKWKEYYYGVEPFDLPAKYALEKKP